MDVQTITILGIACALGVAFCLWVQLDGWLSARRHPYVAPTYECDPETCSHEWEVAEVVEAEETIGYSSTGGADPVGYVTYTHYRCPKCGSTKVEASDPVPL